jgi:hypothetical protein
MHPGRGRSCPATGAIAPPIPGPSRTADPSRYSVAVPIREADATAWLPQGEIQRLLSAGWKETGGPSDEFLGSLIEKAVTAARREPQVTEREIGIGEGEPGWRGPFQQVWNELMKRGLWIGNPASTVYRDGPGVVQHFEAPHLMFGWVLAALPHRRPVAFEGETWQALQRTGEAALGGDALLAVGYPVPELQDTRVVNTSSASIDLTGGSWGDGRLVRDKDTGEWSWEPAVSFDLRMSRAATTWTGGMDPQMLRLRAVATLPLARVGGLGITPERRRAFEGQLPNSALANLITRLCGRRNASLQASEWIRGPHQNARDWLSCSTFVGMPDGRRVLEGEVMIALPNASGSSVITCAEIRVLDLDSWVSAAATSAVPTLPDFRLSTQEVADFFIAAWQTATEFLPRGVADEADRLTWAYPPSVDLRIVSEHRIDGEKYPTRFLDDYIDLTPLGWSDRGQIREMAVTVTAPLAPDATQRRDLTRQALTYMAEHHGFLDVTDWLF